jgi:hypothetical protein
MLAMLMSMRSLECWKDGEGLSQATESHPRLRIKASSSAGTGLLPCGEIAGVLGIHVQIRGSGVGMG